MDFEPGAPRRVSPGDRLFASARAPRIRLCEKPRSAKVAKVPAAVCRAGVLAAGVAAVLVLPLAGCGPTRTPYPESLNSHRPEERILAAKHAAEIGDRDVIGILVDRLEDDDEAVRLFAILALEKLTGTRHGYDYHADQSLRQRAVERWRRYVALQSASSPASPGVRE